MHKPSPTIMDIREHVKTKTSSSTEQELKKCEDLIIQAAKKMSSDKDTKGILELMEESRAFYECIGRARASRLMRSLLEYALDVEQDKKEKISMVRECITWAKENKREFLRRTLQARLSKLYNELHEYVEAQKMAQSVISEVKKLEDRELLVELSLEESKSYFHLNNFSKAKSSLMTAKTTTTSAYVSVEMQANIDLQSGILYTAEERDFRTSYSYFFEAFEGFSSVKKMDKAALALKYMLLCKIMLNDTDSVKALLSTKEFASVRSKGVEGMMKMADAFKTRSLKTFQKVLGEYKAELTEDRVVANHSYNLQKGMLEKELSRLIEPYSEVELSYLSRQTDISVVQIEKALATMILDRKIYGNIDQRKGEITIYPKPSSEKQFKQAMKTIKNVAKVVDASFARSTGIH